MTKDKLSSVRTHNYIRQIKGSVVFKGAAILASFVAIPIMIRYLGQERYGVWSTLLTIMSWIVFFDLGIGNGLRNKVAESIAKNRRDEATHYIASAYTLIGIGACVIYALIALSIPYIPWQTIFNTQAVSQLELEQTVRIVSFFVLLNFWIGLVSALISAVQKTSIITLGQLVSNVLVLMLVVVLAKLSDASIVKLAYVHGIAMIFASLLLSFLFFRGNMDFLPKLHFNKAHIQPLLTIGVKFFLIQLAVLVIFTTDKLLITQLFGPEFVTEYDVVYKLFGLITVSHALITAPLWSAYTDAYHRADFAWIKSMIKNQLGIFVLMVGAAIAMGILAKPIIKIWIGDGINVSMTLVLVMVLFVAISTWNNVFAVLVNGIGQIKVQLYTAIIAMSINVPLSWFLVTKLGFGVSGVVLGTCISLSLAAVFLPVQVWRLFRVKHSGLVHD